MRTNDRPDGPRLLAICLNPAIDRVITAPGAAGGGTVRALRVLDTAGGKATHAAVVGARFGAEVRLVAPVGGERGRTFTHLLEGSGVRIEPVPVGSEIRETWTVVDPEVGDVLEVIGVSPRLSRGEVERLLGVAIDLLGWATEAILAGSAPEGVDPGAYADIVSEARARGIRIFLDAAGDALRAGLRGRPHLACPNILEACLVLGRRPPDEPSLPVALELARGIRSFGAEAVALTAGSWGALLLLPGGAVWWARPPTRRRVNAVGCGDAFLGALAVAIGRGDTFPEAVRWATAAAVDKLGRLDPGEVDPEAACLAVADVELRRVE